MPKNLGKSTTYKYPHYCLGGCGRELIGTKLRCISCRLKQMNEYSKKRHKEKIKATYLVAFIVGMQLTEGLRHWTGKHHVQRLVVQIRSTL
jgi:hypothetical protein